MRDSWVVGRDSTQPGPGTSHQSRVTALRTAKACPEQVEGTQRTRRKDKNKSTHDPRSTIHGSYEPQRRREIQGSKNLTFQLWRAGVVAQRREKNIALESAVRCQRSHNSVAPSFRCLETRRCFSWVHTPHHSSASHRATRLALIHHEPLIRKKAANAINTAVPKSMKGRSQRVLDSFRVGSTDT